MINTLFAVKKIIPYSRLEKLENHTLSGGTYPYSYAHMWLYITNLAKFPGGASGYSHIYNWYGYVPPNMQGRALRLKTETM